MSEFPFPPERLWQQYVDGPDSGPPPPAPLDGDFVLFGGQTQMRDYLGLLKSSDVAPIFDSNSSKLSVELSKLNLKLLKFFLAMLDEMLNNSAIAGDAQTFTGLAATENLEEIKHILLNMHHVLNLYRPHQAREVLVNMLQSQQKRRKQAAMEVTEEVQSVINSMDKCITRLQQAGARQIEELCATAGTLTKVPETEGASAASETVSATPVSGASADRKRKSTEHSEDDQTTTEPYEERLRLHLLPRA
jgi:mediator of RNA polymerase II transcription subunit 7